MRLFSKRNQPPKNDFIHKEFYERPSNLDSKINLWIPYYSMKIDDPHTQEIEHAILLNSRNPHIEKIYIVNESDTFPLFLENNPKVEEIKFSGRSTYNDIFKMFIKDQINVLLNSDIVIDYDDTLHFLKISDKEFWCISRYQVPDDFDYNSMKNFEIIREKAIPYFSDDDFSISQDVWAFRGLPDIDCNVHMGIQGCENHLAYIASSKYLLLNPCKSIRSYHFHKETKRENIQRIISTYSILMPSFVDTQIFYWKDFYYFV